MDHLPLTLLDGQPGFVGRLPMRQIKPLRVRQERAETGFCTKVNRPTVIFGIREILQVGIMEHPSAKSDKSLRAYLQ